MLQCGAAVGLEGFVYRLALHLDSPIPCQLMYPVMLVSYSWGHRSSCVQQECVSVVMCCLAGSDSSKPRASSFVFACAWL